MGLFDWVPKLPVPAMDWKTVAAVVAGTAVFVGLTVLTGGLPLVATLAVAGFGSGVAGQLVYDLLDNRKPGVDLLVAGVVSVGLTFVGAGVGRVVGPLVGKALERTGIAAAIARSPVGQLVTRAAGEVEGNLAGTVGKVIQGVREANPRLGGPQLLDPVVFNPPVPAPAASAPAMPDPVRVAKGFVKALGGD
jgi:hypothetical protein